MAKQFDIDFKDFEQKFNKIVKITVPKLAEKGLARAGMQLLNDSIMQQPTVPHKEGWLRGSGSVFVQNELAAESSSGKKGKAAKSHTEPIKRNEIVAVVGFNTPYAARLHEHPEFRFKEPGAGGKFLESKMSRFKSLYFKIVANAIKEREK